MRIVHNKLRCGRRIDALREHITGLLIRRQSKRREHMPVLMVRGQQVCVGLLES